MVTCERKTEEKQEENRSDQENAFATTILQRLTKEKENNPCARMIKQRNLAGEARSNCAMLTTVATAVGRFK